MELAGKEDMIMEKVVENTMAPSTADFGRATKVVVEKGKQSISCFQLKHLAIDALFFIKSLQEIQIQQQI